MHHRIINDSTKKRPSPRGERANEVGEGIHYNLRCEKIGQFVHSKPKAYPSVTATPCHLPLGKGGVSRCSQAILCVSAGVGISYYSSFSFCLTVLSIYSQPQVPIIPGSDDDNPVELDEIDF